MNHRILCQTGTSRKFRKRDRLPLDSRYFWDIESGFVRTLTWLEDGTVINLGLWGVGHKVGQALSNIRPLEIECLSPVLAKVILLEDFQADLQMERQVLLDHLQLTEELALIRSYPSVESRLLHFLMWLAKRYGYVESEGQALDFFLSHQDIAEYLSTTRVTVTKLMSRLEEHKVIQRLPMKKIVIQPESGWYYQI